VCFSKKQETNLYLEGKNLFRKTVENQQVLLLMKRDSAVGTVKGFSLKIYSKKEGKN